MVDSYILVYYNNPCEYTLEKIDKIEYDIDSIRNTKEHNEIYVYWHLFEDMCSYLLYKIDDLELDMDKTLLCGIVRGSLPLLTRMSHLLDNNNVGIIDFRTRDYASNNKPLYYLPDLSKYNNIIIFEDIIDTGLTIKTILNDDKFNNKNVYVFSLFKYKDVEIGESCLELDRNVFSNHWIIFPWEIK